MQRKLLWPTACCVCCSSESGAGKPCPEVGNRRYCGLPLLAWGRMTGKVLIVIQLTPWAPTAQPTPPYNIMGSTNSDSRVRIYTQIGTPIIYAGQYLDGTAHLEVLEDTAYPSITLSLIGTEEVAWSESSEKILSIYRNSRKTYGEEFVLSRFEGGLKRGHYSFPFTVLLPSSLPASALLAPRNAINFTLAITLPPGEAQGEAQSCRTALNVREPLRAVTSLSQSGSCTSECWKCMGSKTSGIFQLEVEKNEIKYGQPFKIKGFIDNANGQFDVHSFCVLLIRRVTRVSQEGRVRVRDEELCELVRPKPGVKVGMQKKFEAEVTLPKEMREYTAIGSILSRCYYLTLLGEAACCYSDTRIEKYVHINNDCPPELPPPPQPPLGWNPQLHPNSTLIALRPYLYHPCAELKVLNQQGSAVLPLPPESSQEMLKA